MTTARSKSLSFALAAALLAAAGLGFWQWQKHRDSGPGASPSRAEVGGAQAFALADCKARLFDGSPTVAVMFTQPLARSQDFGKLVKAKEGDKPVAGRWVLGDNPRSLFLANATPDAEYGIELSADVQAASGGKLATAQRCDVKAEAMPDAFYFASKGVVLPAGQNGGLPVVTVNTPEVDVQFLRVDDGALPRFLEQVGGRPKAASGGESDDESADSGGDYYDNQRKLKGTISGYALDELRDSATSVYMGRFGTDARKNRRNVSFLPVEKIKELQEPGVYVAVMNPPGRFGWDFQVTYFYVTDIGLHVHRHTAQTDVFATSLKKGEALRDIEVSLIDDSGKSIAQARTDAQGHAVFTGSTDKARALLARRGKEMSVIAMRDPALDLSEFDIGGHPSRNRKLFVYAGRDLYRPGETFNVSVLARDADGKPLPTAAGAASPLTLVLKKPDGSQAQTQLVRPHASGSAYYQQTFSLPANAPTGRWLLEARTDPGAKRADAQWAFSVEEFLPERMKLQIKAPEAVLRDKGELAVDVQGDYLYGAPAAGNRLLAGLTTERQRNPVARQWPGFIFGDVADDAERKRQDLGEQQLDEAGKAEVAVPLDLSGRKSPMTVRASFSLLESGGRPVVRSIERTWWPAPALVGLRPLFERDVAQEGSLAEFELTRVDTDGKFAAGKDLQVRLVREDRQWYWRYDDGRGWHSGYNEQEELVEARSVASKARAKLGLPVKYGRYRVELTDTETGQTARYRFYAGWGAQDADDVGNRPDRVQLKLEGAPFKAGGKARLTITPPHDGEALLTVEGDRVLYQKRLAVRTGGTVAEFDIDPAWQRHDLYVGVVAFRPGSAGDRVTPARAIGLAHLPLARDERKLKLSLTAPAKAVPEQSVPVKVKLLDASGKPLAAGADAIVTVSAVDVGILDITHYATPDPADFFFGKHRYGADLLDHYGKLIEAMEGNTAKQRFGGDAGMRDTQSMPRKVRLVDLFSGPVKLDANGEATIPLTLPDFNGTLRLMAVASTADSYASTQAEMQVAAPLVAELSMPRFLSPGDSATIALDVTNLSGAEQQVSVKVEAASPLKVTGATAPVKLADKQRTVLRYQAEAIEADGLAQLKLTVTAGKLKVVREAFLQVQPATPRVREVRRVRLEPNGSVKLDALLADGLWAGSATVDVTVSNKPPIDVRNVVRGLLMYPYGCLEQTTSSAYPLVFIDEAGAQAYKMTPLSREERAKRLDTAFSGLAGMQQQQGGFGLWAAHNPYEAWLSAYVTGFLQDAKDGGFAVPEAMHQRAMASLLEQFQKAPGYQTQPPKEIRRDAQGRVADYREVESLRLAHQRLAEAAYAGYILAREQKAPLATLRALHDTYRGNARSPLALVHLSLALKLMGDEARAKVALDDAMQLPYGIQPRGDHDYQWGEWLGDYGSRIRDQALAYSLLHRHQVAHPRRENLLVDLAEDFDKRQYFSTQERLALFLAARAAGGSQGDNAPPWKATLQLADKAEPLSGKDAEQRQLTAAMLKRGVSVASQSAAPLFVEVAVEGYPMKPQPPKDDRIAVERSWWTVKGEAARGRQFKTGEMLIVRLRATSRQRVKDGLIVDRIPAGMEIENLNLSQGVKAGEFTVEGVNVAQAMENQRIKHREYRDDRFVAAAELNGEALDVFYLLRVVTPGKFVVPAPFAEDMYRPEVRGIGKGEADVTVANPK